MITQEVKFITNNRPGMKSGSYHLEVEQRLSIDHAEQPDRFATKKALAVAGERWSMAPELVHACFPPAGSLGANFAALPHVSIKRTSFPWEWSLVRESDQDKHTTEQLRETPWVALLVLRESDQPGCSISKADFEAKVSNDAQLWQTLLTLEWLYPTSEADTFIAASPSKRKAAHLPDAHSAKEAPVLTYLKKRQQLQSVTVKELATASSKSWLKWPGRKPLVFEDEAAKVRVLDLPWNVLKDVLPTTSDMHCLAHVRYGIEKLETGEEIPTSEQLATIVGNRAPFPGETTTAMLVSLEGRCDNHGNFVSQGASDHDLVRLVVLHQWSFSCLNAEHTFAGYLRGLNGYNEQPGNTSHLYNGKAVEAGLRLPIPPEASPLVKPFLVQGSVPLLHKMRAGSRSMSWYHGPLVPGKYLEHLHIRERTEGGLVENADELLQYDTNTNMLEVSHSAAWELGRLVMLEQKELAKQLHQWKRQHQAGLRKLEQYTVSAHLPFQDDTVPDFPPRLATWFRELRLLQHIPLHYLLPDPRLLEKESLKFFQVDEVWMEALIDGAFSIGRVPYREKAVPRNFQTAKAVSGFLLRSELVSGWPDLLFEGYDALPGTTDRALTDMTKLKGHQLRVLRQQKLTDHVLLVLFDGELKTLDIHLKPEALHFGYTQPSSASDTKLDKALRKSNGHVDAGKTFNITWRDAATRVVNATAQAQAIQTAIQRPTALNPAEFAFYMVQGVPKMRYLNGGTRATMNNP